MLRRIEVKNFKSLKHLDYRCAKLNLLMGLNGAGKSSFVQSLLLLRALENHVEKECYEMPLCEIVGDDDEGATFEDLKYCYAKPNEDVEFRVDFDVKIRTVKDAREVGSIARVVRPGNREDSVIEVWNPDCLKERDVADNFITRQRDAYALKVENNESITAEEYERMEADEKQVVNEAMSHIREAMKHESPFIEDYRSLWKRANMVSAFRGHPRQIHRGDPKGSWLFGVRFNPEGNDVGGFLAECGMQCCLYESPREKNPLIFPGAEMHESTIPDDDRKHTFLLEQVQLWLNIVSPGAKVSFEKVMVGNRKRYVQSVAYGDKKFKPENVGFGVSDILPVLTALLTSRPGDIVIIENPEAHLHPKGQAKMGELLARAAAYGVQLFVETHSDHVINGIRVAAAEKIIKSEDVNIAFFERKEHCDLSVDGAVKNETYAEVRNIKVDDQGSLSEYPADFMDEWNNQLMELIS